MGKYDCAWMVPINHTYYVSNTIIVFFVGNLQEVVTKPTTPGATVPACTCQWVGCYREFKNVLELGTHMLTAGIHIVKQG